MNIVIRAGQNGDRPKKTKRTAAITFGLLAFAYAGIGYGLALAGLAVFVSLHYKWPIIPGYDAQVVFCVILFVGMSIGAVLHLHQFAKLFTPPTSSRGIAS